MQTPQGAKISTMFKTVDGELKVFNKTILSTQNNLKNLQTQTANLSYYTSGGSHVNLQNVPIAQPQTVSNFTKLNNAFKVYNGNLTKSTGLQNAYIKSVGTQNQALGNYLAGLNGTKASMGGYITSLISAKAATIGLQVASMALNMALSMGVAFAIQGIITLFDKLITTSKEQAEKLQNVKQEYENVKSELQSLNDELKTTEERMTELENKDTLTFTEKKEYDNLVKTNNELQRKIDLLELEEKIKNKEKNKTFVDTMNKSGNAAVTMMGNTTSLKTKDFAMAEISRYESLVADGITEDEEKQIEYLEGYLQDLSDEWGDYAKDISYISNPTNEDEEKVNEWLDFVNDFQDRMAIAMGGTNAETNAFNRVVDNWQFDEVVQGLQDLGEEGKVTAEMLNDPKYNEFIQKLVYLGIIDSADNLDEIALAFNNVGTEAENSGENVNKMTVSLSELESASDKIKTLGSAFKELSDDGYITTKTLGEIQTATGLSGDEWAEYESKLLNVKKGSAEFSQIMADLTYKMLDQTFANKDLNSLTEQQISAILRENGVVNADAVAHDWLTKAKETLRIKTALAKASTAEAVVALATEASQAGITGNALNDLIMDMGIFNNTNLDVSQKVAALQEMGYYAHWTAQGLANIDKVKKYSFDGKDYIASYDKDGKLVGIEQEKQVEIPNVEIPKITIPNYSGATSGGKSGSDKNKPDYEDPTDAIINRINLRADELAQQEEEIQNLIEIAELEKDYKKQISLTNDLIAKRKDRLTELKTANAGLHNEAEWLRNSTPQWNEEEWFDSQGNATKAYIDFINDRIKSGADKEEVDAIKDQFEAISKYKKAYMDNTEEIAGINKEILQDEEKIWDLRREEFDARMEESEYYIQHSKDFGWENGDNEIAARNRVLDWIQSDYYKSLIKDDVEYYKLLEEHRLNYIEAQKEEFNKANDFASSYIDSQKTLLQSYFDVTNSIVEAQHEINKELETSKTMYEWLDEDSRKLLFNQEDYNTLSEELYDIQYKADKLRRQYERDLENSTLDTIEQITSNYEMQYDMLMKSYEIAKADLEIAKKKQKLNNVLNERNVRMFINGQWQWVANTQDVIDAKSELADAEYARRTAEAEKTQTESLNHLTAQQDELKTVINMFESGVIDLGTAVYKVTQMFGSLPSAMEQAFTLITGRTGSGSSGGSHGITYSYNGISYDPNFDYSAAMNNVPVGSDAWNRMNQRRNAKILGEGLDYKPFATGTKYTPAGNLLLGEEEPETFINNNGHLIPINQPTLGNFGAGGIVFNQDQMANLRSLWDLSNIGIASHNNLIGANRTQNIDNRVDNSYHVYIQNLEVDNGVIDINALKRYIPIH